MIRIILTFFLIYITNSSCKEADEPLLSSENQILSFKFNSIDVQGLVDDESRSISATVSSKVDLSTLAPTITVSDGAIIDPASDVANDFRTDVFYKVTAQDGTIANYFIKVSQLNDDNSITYFNLPDIFQKGKITNNIISFTLPFGTDLTSLKVEFNKPPKATTNIASGTVIDLSSTKQLVVTSEYGSVNTYSIQIAFEPQETGIRGVWITNVASDVLNTRLNIASAMKQLSDLNFNTVFLVAWNKTMTPHPSQVLKEALAPLDDPNIQTEFFPGRDVLQEVIEEAHLRGLKVIPWFEYGFASQYGSTNGGRNKVLLAHPEWESRDQSGKVANKNNFYWMNAFHPDVQKFMSDLIMEVVLKYDIDGIQGDDRLPAVTSSSGYDAYTVQRYQNEHNGQSPPTGEQTQSWVQWRSNILNDFAKDLFVRVKNAKPNCLVTYSPSPYSFSLFNYCQDWPTWVDDQVVEILSPQLYRYDNQGIDTYKYLLATNLAYANNNTSIFYPGVLLRSGSYTPSEAYLVEVIRANRAKGVKGEVYFFYEGVGTRAKVFKALYPGKAIFPTF